MSMVHIEEFYGKVVLIAALFVVSASGLPGGNVYVNKYYLDKQKFLFEIVHNVQDPLANFQWIYVGRTLVLDKTKYIDFNTLMEKYLLKINTNLLLPFNNNFVLADKTHLEELKGLYYFLYNAQDFETLRQNICWARMHVQPQMFVFALTQILLKREDFKDLNLPKIYEIWPQHFLSDKHVRKFQYFNYIQFDETDVYEECYKDKIELRNRTCKRGQWWCKRNLQYQMYKEKEGVILPKIVYGGFRSSSKWLQALEDVSIYWLPVDFSSDLAAGREITYLIEDKSWNAYWYYINMGLWLSEGGRNDLYTKSLRDWWFWNLQQIIARYKMEGPSKKSQNNLEPFLINYQGLTYKPINDKTSQGISSFINDLFAKTQNALNEQTYKLRNGTILQLNNPDHLEYFLQENFAIENILKLFMSVTDKQQNPILFQNFETMLRSYEFYDYAETIINLYKSLKANFEPYKPQDVQSIGVIVNDVEITELKTYFEIVDTDVTNLLRSSSNYFEGNFLWFKSMLARQQSLQHQPFKFVFNLTSDKPQAVLVRTFLARDCTAAEGAKCTTPTDLFQLDTFVSTLDEGYNIIDRESTEFYGYMLPSLTYTELYHFTRLALNEKYKYPLNITLGNCRFPHHLMLPKGLQGQGLPVKFVFVVTAYNYRFHRGLNLDCDFSSGIQTFDNFPPGFPFHRDISDSVYLMDNVLIKNMKIYHEDNVQYN